MTKKPMGDPQGLRTSGGGNLAKAQKQPKGSVRQPKKGK